MAVKIVVVRIKHPEGKIGILFHSDCTGEKDLPQVSLSRKKGGCLFTVDKLHEHDNHTPWHDDQASANAYCDRVVGDIKAGLDKKGVKYEIVFTEAQLKQPSPAEVMHAALAQGQVVWRPGQQIQQPSADDKLGALIAEKLVVTKDAGRLPLGVPYIPN